MWNCTFNLSRSSITIALQSSTVLGSIIFYTAVAFVYLSLLRNNSPPVEDNFVLSRIKIWGICSMWGVICDVFFCVLLVYVWLLFGVCDVRKVSFVGVFFDA